MSRNIVIHMMLVVRYETLHSLLVGTIAKASKDLIFDNKLVK